MKNILGKILSFAISAIVIVLMAWRMDCSPDFSNGFCDQYGFSYWLKNMAIKEFAIIFLVFSLLIVILAIKESFDNLKRQ